MKLLRILWWALALAVLILWSIGERRAPGTDAFVVLGWGMLVLAFPISLVMSLLWAAVAFGASAAGLPLEGPIAAVVFWLTCAVAGDLQWFRLLPWAWRRLQRSRGDS